MVVICISLMAMILGIFSCACHVLILSVTVSYKLMLTAIVPDDPSAQKYLRACTVYGLTPEAGKSSGPCLSDVQGRRTEKPC